MEHKKSIRKMAKASPLMLNKGSIAIPPLFENRGLIRGFPLFAIL